MPNTRYHGKKGVVYISTTGSGNAVAAISLSKWSLNMNTDTVETTAFGDVNKTYVQGLPDAQGSLSGFWDSASDDLYDGSRSADGVKMYLYPSSDAPSKFWSGPAWLDYSMDVANNGAITVTANWKANGAWSQA